MLKSILLAYLLTRLEPIHNWAEDKINNSKSVLLSIIAHIISNKLTRCLKCTSFWITLIMTTNIYLAIIAMIIGFVYDKNFSQWETKIKF